LEAPVVWGEGGRERGGTNGWEEEGGRTEGRQGGRERRREGGRERRMASYLIAHDTGGGDSTELAKAGAQPLVIQRFIEILHVQVAALGRGREGGREGGRRGKGGRVSNDAT